MRMFWVLERRKVWSKNRYFATQGNRFVWTEGRRRRAGCILSWTMKNCGYVGTLSLVKRLSSVKSPWFCRFP